MLTQEQFKKVRECCAECAVYWCDGAFTKSRMLQELNACDAATIMQIHSDNKESAREFPEVKTILVKYGFL